MVRLVHSVHGIIDIGFPHVERAQFAHTDTTVSYHKYTENSTYILDIFAFFRYFFRA